MPQDTPYTLVLDNETSIEIHPSKLPRGFEKMSPSEKHETARNLVKEHVEKIQRSQQPPTTRDFLVPLGILFALTLVIIIIAKRIRKNPKLYDKVVKLDGEPNPEYGKGWKDKDQD